MLNSMVECTYDEEKLEVKRMSEAVSRQFFMDFIENLGNHVSGDEEFEEEECNMILCDLFFAGQMEIKWNPKTETLMFKPTIVINIKKKGK